MQPVSGIRRQSFWAPAVGAQAAVEPGGLAVQAAQVVPEEVAAQSHAAWVAVSVQLELLVR